MQTAQTTLPDINIKMHLVINNFTKQKQKNASCINKIAKTNCINQIVEWKLRKILYS